MNVICNNCGKDTTATVTRTAPHKVICEHCSEPIENISSFVIASLVRDKKFAIETKKAFAFYCDHDKQRLPGVLAQDTNGQSYVKCSKCNNKMAVSEFMISQFKEINKIK